MEGPFRCLTEPRLGLHFVPNAVDLVRLTSVFIFIRRIKILSLQSFEVFFGVVYLFAIYKYPSVEDWNIWMQNLALSALYVAGNYLQGTIC